MTSLDSAPKAVAPHRFDPTILREYDIRGTWGRTLGVADALAIGLAFGTRVREAGGIGVAVGQDGRLSSPALADALVDGLAATGLAVHRIGVGPTPMLYFATLTLPADAGIMVTGSHNPPADNGFKMMLGRRPFFGADIRGLAGVAESARFASGAGSVATIDVIDQYVERLLADAPVSGTPAVAWDTGNGAAGEVVRRLTARLPGRHLLLNDVIDGHFPAHHPDPTEPETLVQLIELVRRERLDLGIAFDGDADRIGVVDGQGRILWGDQLMMLYAADVLSRHPGAPIIADVKASQLLFDEIARLGGTPVMWKTGHSLIKAKMAESGALLAGEMSGHIFFADGYFGFDDALYAAVRLLRLLADGGPTLAARRDRFPTAVSTPELRLLCDESRKFAIVEEVKAGLRAAGARVSDVDGVRVATADGWWLMRASNTQPALVVRCEAADRAGLARLKAELSGWLAKSGLALPADGHG